MRRIPWPGWLIGAGILALVAAAVLYLAPSDRYIFLPDEARPLEPRVEVEGEKPDQNGGGIYYVAVDVRKASVLEKLFPGLYEGATPGAGVQRARTRDRTSGRAAAASSRRCSEARSTRRRWRSGSSTTGSRRGASASPSREPSRATRLPGSSGAATGSGRSTALPCAGRSRSLAGCPRRSRATA